MKGDRWLEPHLVWAEIDLNAVSHNVRALRNITHAGARLMAVVKADAYGHGAGEIARQALRHGADALGVADIGEAVQLRKAGIAAPVLIFGHTPPEQASRLVQFGLTQTVYSLPYARELCQALASRSHKIKIHLKIDTGMGRLGLPVHDMADAMDQALRILSLTGIELEGIYTHFATADSADKTFTLQQFDRFTDLANRLRQEGIQPPVAHAANSAATIDLPGTHLDMVRTGIALYGLYPSPEVSRSRIDLHPVMALKSRVVQLKQVPSGSTISYGATCITPGPTTIATIPVGYADGLNRLLSSRGEMLVRGERAPVAGRICMDMTMLDVGHIPEVQENDEVVIFGTQGDAQIHVDEIAASLNTINYEIVTCFAHVPRVYI